MLIANKKTGTTEIPSSLFVCQFSIPALAVLGIVLLVFQHQNSFVQQVVDGLHKLFFGKFAPCFTAKIALQTQIFASVVANVFVFWQNVFGKNNGSNASRFGILFFAFCVLAKSKRAGRQQRAHGYFS